MTLSCIKHQFFKTSQSYTVPFNGAMKNTRFPSQLYIRLVRPGCIPTMGQSSRSTPSNHCLLWVALEALMPLAAQAPDIDDRNGWKCDWIVDTTRHTSWSNNIKVLRIIIWITVSWIIHSSWWLEDSLVAFHDNAQRQHILRGWVHAFPASLGCHSQGPPHHPCYPPATDSTPAKRLDLMARKWASGIFWR